MAVVLGVTRRDIASLINGKSQPTEESFSPGISPALAGGHITLYKEIIDFDRDNEKKSVRHSLSTNRETCGTPRGQA